MSWSERQFKRIVLFENKQVEGAPKVHASHDLGDPQVFEAKEG